MGNPKQVDMAGMTVVVDGIRVGATTPGATGTELTGSEVALLDGLTAGTVTASKAVVVDANKDASAFRNVVVTNLDAGASATAGTVDIFPTTASKGKLAITCTDQTGNTTVTLTAGAMGQATAVTIPDPGAAAASVVLTEGTQTVNGAKTLADPRVPQAVTNVHDTTPTQAEMVTALGAAARGKIGTIDDNDGNTVGYLCFSSDASWYFIAGTKGA